MEGKQLTISGMLASCIAISQAQGRDITLNELNMLESLLFDTREEVIKFIRIMKIKAREKE